MRQRAALIGVTAARPRLVIGALDRVDTPPGTYDMSDLVSLKTACALIKSLNPNASLAIDWTDRSHEEAANA